MTQILETVLWIQGVYFLVTGIWPLVYYSSFETITGPKTDVWLVKAVGALLAVTGCTLLNAALHPGAATMGTLIIGAGTALVLLLVDLIYVSKAVISKIYLLDACIQLLLITLWCLHILTLEHA